MEGGVPHGRPRSEADPDVSTTRDAGRFVAEHTEPTRTVLVPEIVLRLATQPFGIFHAAERNKADRPYWAFAWSGGQAIARYMLDNPHVVGGKRVWDIGSGSALTAIAARMAGATQAVAADTDPMACAAARLNGAANAVELEVTADDLLGRDVDADLIVIGDLFYEPELALRVTAFLERAVRRGMPVLFGDRATMRRPPLEMELVGEYPAALTPHMEIGYVDQARIWRVVPRAGVRRG